MDNRTNANVMVSREIPMRAFAVNLWLMPLEVLYFPLMFLRGSQ
jgi:hypothetical protein